MNWQKMLLAVVVLAGLAAFVAAGYSDGDSALYNYPWTVRYLEAFESGALLPRHLPGLWAGLGGYDFFFYAPLPFWVIAAIVNPICPECSPASELVLGAGLFWLFGGLSFFLFIRRYVNSRIAVLGAITYSVLPYHLWVDWFVRQAVGEFAAYAFIPVAAYGFDAVRLNTRHQWTLSVGIAGVFLSHLPTALLAAHVLALLTLIATLTKSLQKTARWRFVAEVAARSVLGACLAAFYWLPAVSLIGTVSEGVLYTDHFMSARWLYGGDEPAPNPATSELVLMSFLALLPSIILAGIVTRGTLRIWVIAPVLLAVLLNTQASEFIWNSWIINKVQFPWRFMVFVDFSAAIAVTAAIAHIRPRLRARVLGALLLLALVPLIHVGSFAVTWARLAYDPRDNWGGAVEYFSPEMLATLRARTGNDGLNALNNNEIIAEIRLIKEELLASPDLPASYQIRPRTVTFGANDEKQRALLPVQYWSLWRGTLDDGTPVTVSPNPQTGTIEVAAPREGFQGRQVTLTLPLHTSEKLGFLITALSIAILAVQVFRGQRNTKKQPTALPNRASN